MLARSSLISFFSVMFFSSVVLSEPSETFLSKFRSTDSTHGLYEINKEAIKFINTENNRLGIHRRSLEPNFKISVPRCETPLKTGWTPQSYGLGKYSVAVYCNKTVSGSYEKKWRVDVPTAP
ncbi:hypothetical protein OH773_01335 [Buttiauxella sp. WJP83]|uniref:hypothetical protein n=1 Tax=Buttiauxella sp. WJP83 TaxID=2986951 RepID=UPI0022DE5AC8|nr:hypothetical protein [Buttiauxella sp. WJP83]WBM70940.1 hypothetical protein OH773_01335 [Buttiauxella sp. WJP83]